MSQIVEVVRDFFGMDIPERTLNLQFTLPTVSDKFDMSEMDNDAFNDDLEAYKDVPEKYFKVLLNGVKHLNHCEMKPRHRRALNDDILSLFFPAAMAQLAKHAKTGGVPEPDDRKHILRAIVDLAQTLIVSHQILFSGYYHDSNYHYVHSHDEVLQSVARIFELFLLKQQAKALRYQVLLPEDWEVINTLFYVMYHYDDVEDPLPTLKKQLKIGRNFQDISLQDRFVLLHCVARFDVLRWPTQIQWVIASYVRSIENVALVRVDDGELAAEELVVYCYGGQPASERRLAAPPGDSLIMDCRYLVDAMHKDCVGMMRAKKHHDISAVLPRFAQLPEEEHFVIFDQLVRGFSHQNDHPSVNHPQTVEDLRVFVGFAEVFSLLNHRQSIFASEDRLVDSLARRSALLAEDHLATEKSIWTVVFQNEQMVRLSTQESPFTTAMRIGSLLACGLGENVNRPSLAVVSRIHRARSKVVEIDIQRLASYAQPVMISINQPVEQPVSSEQQKSALLVYDHQHPGKWGLMFPPRDVVLGVDQFALHRGGHSLPIHLKGMRNATNDFYLFSTELRSEQIGVAGEPDYPTPPTLLHHAAGWLI